MYFQTQWIWLLGKWATMEWKGISEKWDEEILQIHLHDRVKHCVELCDLVLNEKQGYKKMFIWKIPNWFYNEVKQFTYHNAIIVPPFK